MSRHNTTLDEMVRFLWCHYQGIKGGGTPGTGTNPFYTADTYADAEALANGAAKIIIVEQDETNNGDRTTYFWDGAVLSPLGSTPLPITKDELDLVDPVYPKDPVTLSFLEGKLDPIQEILDSLEGATSSDDILALLDQLKAQAYPTMEPAWNNIEVTTTGVSASGASINTAEGTITIPNGSTGAGSYLRKDFSIAGNPLNKEGDVITYEIIMRESYFGALTPNLQITMTKNNIAVPALEITAVDMGNKVLQYTFDDVIDDPADIISIRVSMGASSPAAIANVIFTWNSLAYTNPKERHSTLISKVADTLKNADTMYTTFSRRSRTTKANIYNTTDNALLMQDEIYDASQTSGIYILPKNANIYIGSPLIINGSLRIIGAGRTTVLNNALNGALFKIATNDDVIFEDFRVYRQLGQFAASAVEYSDQFINKRGRFRNMVFSNMVTPVSLNYAEDVVFEQCLFEGGTTPLLIGDKSALSVKNVTVKECDFSAYTSIGISSLTGNDLTIKGNNFLGLDGVNTYGNRGVVVAVTGITSENLRIEDNDFKYYKEYAVRIATGVGGKINTSYITGNTMKDGSATATSAGIYASGIAAGSVNGMEIDGNTIYTKVDAVTAQIINDLSVVKNKFYQHAAGFNSARGIKLISSPDSPVILANQYGPNLQPNQL